nr:Glyoxalase/bleomycin resistance protein/dioxygenase [uncultured marine thaumarchaeote KM3_186_G04]
MKKSVDFYSKIPNFKIVYGGSDNWFTSFLIDDVAKSYLNLRINDVAAEAPHWSRIVFYVDDVDELFAYMENDETISGLGKLESKPEDATWGERFFHMLDPDGYKLSFATPIGD